jgi:glycosyltransferase involved in cell wall biosynthesis
MKVGAVAIGRNEGERLRRCLESLRPEVGRVVYVDSGSTDGSVELARGMGIEVVELDRATPFTAARARNAGFAALDAAGPLDAVQFVDGDCSVEPGWIAAATAALAGQRDLGIVTGWRTEIDPERNIYHRMAEVEWHRPAGDIRACGGDMMVRAEVFRRLGGFNGSIICSEDEEFCLRVAAAGHRVHRLPLIMTHHDINMTRLSEWWRRTERAGHGFAEVGGMYPDHFRKERLRAVAYGAGLPVVAIAGLLFGWVWVPAAVLLVYVASWLRTARGLRAQDMPPAEAFQQAGFLTLSKFPALLGMLRYHLRRARGAEMRLIEYK